MAGRGLWVELYQIDGFGKADLNELFYLLDDQALVEGGVLLDDLRDPCENLLPLGYVLRL